LSTSDFGYPQQLLVGRLRDLTKRLLSQTPVHSGAHHLEPATLGLAIQNMAQYLPETMKSMAERGIPVAQLSIISLAKLNAGDPAEAALLGKAASNTGLFYLELQGDTGGERVLAQLPGIYALAEKYFAQPEEIKVQDSRFDIKASQDLGWKKGHGGESFEVVTPDGRAHF